MLITQWYMYPCRPEKSIACLVVNDHVNYAQYVPCFSFILRESDGYVPLINDKWLVLCCDFTSMHSCLISLVQVLVIE